eukprot:s5689_g2.t1
MMAMRVTQAIRPSVGPALVAAGPHENKQPLLRLHFGRRLMECQEGKRVSDGFRAMPLTIEQILAKSRFCVARSACARLAVL